MKLPVITVLLSITKNLWCSLSPRARRRLQRPSVCSGFEGSAQGCSGLSWDHKPQPKQGGRWTRIETPNGFEGLLAQWIWLGFSGVSVLSRNPMAGRLMLKKPPRSRDNNGALQVSLRLFSGRCLNKFSFGSIDLIFTEAVGVFCS